MIDRLEILTREVKCLISDFKVMPPAKAGNQTHLTPLAQLPEQGLIRLVQR